jgi:hypothetical protein
LRAPFEDFEQSLKEQVAAVVEAELLVDPARAERYQSLIEAGRVAPRIIGCQPALPERDPSPAAMEPMWLVLEWTTPVGQRLFLVYDPERQRFGLGEWEDHTAWFRGGSGGFFDLVQQIAAEAGGEAT